MSDDPVTQSPVFSNDDKNDKVREELKEAVKLIRRPTNWRRRSISPFYKERFALEVKRNLDLMAANPLKEDLWYLYKQYENWYKPNSLYLYLNQAMRYLQDYMDETGVYRRLLETIGIERHKDKGIRLFFHKDIKDAVAKPDPTFVSPDKPMYLKEIEDWVEIAIEGDRKVISGLALSDEEIRILEDMFAMSKNINANITCKSITLLMMEL